MFFLFKDDEPITGGADGRDNTHVRKFLSQQHKKIPWKPEVMQIIIFPLAQASS